MKKMARNGQNILGVVRQRHSTRTPYDPSNKVSKKDLAKIIEGARWSPTAHNMQNFEIIIVDNPALLREIGELKSKISEDFLRENYDQLSFSKEELEKKRVGILASGFPQAWRDPKKFHMIARSGTPQPLSRTMEGAPAVLIIVYDPRKRAPASKGDFLGIMSLGCVMENMWLIAESLGISCQIMSVFGGNEVEGKLKHILGIPKYMKIAYALRLGYPLKESPILKVRRDYEVLAHHNRY
jgi:nitroreductase